MDNQTFIGSTTKTLKERMQIHRNTCKLYPQRKLNQHFNKIGIDQFSIIEIETIEDATMLEIMHRENHYIQKYNPSLNPSQEERLAAKRDKILAQQKAYYYKNKDKIIAQMKVQRNQNKVEIAASKHQYYQIHKDEINAKRATAKVICGCGGRYCFNDRSKHSRTGKHQAWLNTE